MRGAETLSCSPPQSRLSPIPRQWRTAAIITVTVAASRAASVGRIALAATVRATSLSGAAV